MTANTPKSRKAKGRVFQQQVREDILEGMDLDPKDVLSTPMGQAGPDIYFAAAAREEFPFGVECKHVDRLDLWGAIRQTEINAFGAGLADFMEKVGPSLEELKGKVGSIEAHLSSGTVIGQKMDQMVGLLAATLLRMERLENKIRNE